MDQLANFVAYSPQVQATPDGQTSSPAGPGSPRRLNPAFAAWLMGWPWWWTNPALDNSAQSAMESYRFALRQRLSDLCGERDMDEAA